MAPLGSEIWKRLKDNLSLEYLVFTVGNGSNQTEISFPSNGILKMNKDSIICDFLFHFRQLRKSPCPNVNKKSIGFEI